MRLRAPVPALLAPAGEVMVDDWIQNKVVGSDLVLVPLWQAEQKLAALTAELGGVRVELLDTKIALDRTTKERDDAFADVAESERLLDTERLASLIHDEWVSWATNLLRHEHGLSQERRARWATLIVTPYAELSDSMKENDRKWARKVRGEAP